MPYRQTDRTEQRRNERRASILAATRALVEQGGLGAVSIQAVAAEAGIATGTVYRYFASKDELTAEVVASICERELAMVAGIAGQREVPAPQRLADAVACFGRRTLASGRTAYAVIAEPTVPEIERLRTQIRRDLAASYAAIVADGIAAGELADQPAEMVGMSIVGAVSEVLVGPVGARPDEGGSAPTVDDLVALVLRSVGAPADITPSPTAALAPDPACDSETNR